MARPKGGGGDSRERLVAAIGRGFRTGGFGGIGVDGLAREAGLTSGAFYAHFKSKAEAFTVALTEGVRSVRDAVSDFQSRHGEGWLAPFVDFYLGERMALDLSQACALPSLSADAARAPAEAQHAYTAELVQVARAIEAGLEGPDRAGRSWQLLAILSGAAAMARAVDDAEVRDGILAAAGRVAKTV